MAYYKMYKIKLTSANIVRCLPNNVKFIGNIREEITSFFHSFLFLVLS